MASLDAARRVGATDPNAAGFGWLAALPGAGSSEIGFSHFVSAPTAFGDVASLQTCIASASAGQLVDHADSPVRFRRPARLRWARGLLPPEPWSGTGAVLRRSAAARLMVAAPA
jgi:hypothetical protein